MRNKDTTDLSKLPWESQPKYWIFAINLKMCYIKVLIMDFQSQASKFVFHLLRISKESSVSTDRDDPT